MLGSHATATLDVADWMACTSFLSCRHGNHRKTIGKPQENHRKTIGKP